MLILFTWKTWTNRKFHMNDATQNVFHAGSLCISNGILLQSFKCAAWSYCAFGIFLLSINSVVVAVVVASAAAAVGFHRIGLIRHLSLNTNSMLGYCVSRLDVFFFFLQFMCVSRDLYFRVFFLVSWHCLRNM